jgi:hypothetical protein
MAVHEFGNVENILENIFAQKKGVMTCALAKTSPRILLWRCDRRADKKRGHGVPCPYGK